MDFEACLDKPYAHQVNARSEKERLKRGSSSVNAGVRGSRHVGEGFMRGARRKDFDCLEKRINNLIWVRMHADRRAGGEREERGILRVGLQPDKTGADPYSDPEQREGRSGHRPPLEHYLDKKLFSAAPMKGFVYFAQLPIRHVRINLSSSDR